MKHPILSGGHVRIGRHIFSLENWMDQWVYINLVRLASWADGYSKGAGKHWKRGCIRMSRKKIAEKIPQVSEPQLRSCIDRLEADGLIQKQPNLPNQKTTDKRPNPRKKGTNIYICHYNDLHPEQANNPPITHQETTDNQPSIERRKKKKKEKDFADNTADSSNDKQQKPRKRTESQLFIDYIKQQYENLYVEWGRDVKIVNMLLETYQREQLQDMFDLYISDTDDYICRNGKDIPKFKYHVSRYVNVARMKKCEICKGSGKEPVKIAGGTKTKMMRCVQCGGTGKVPV